MGKTTILIGRKAFRNFLEAGPDQKEIDVFVGRAGPIMPQALECTSGALWESPPGPPVASLVGNVM